MAGKNVGLTLGLDERSRALVLVMLLLMVLAGPGSSQRPVAPEPPFSRPLLTSAGLGLLGWGVGALVGRGLAGNCGGANCYDKDVMVGGAAGGGLGLALGAHIGNRRRGSLLLDLGTSAAVWGVGYGIMSKFADDENWGALIITGLILPPLQMVGTVLVERVTGRARARR